MPILQIPGMMCIRKAIIIFIAAFVANGDDVNANISIPQVFGSNMVLQQGRENPVWGWADKGERITILFAGKTIKTVAGKDGKWKTNLPSLDYGGPYTLVFTGKNTITLENILIGEVWVCSGQSNMEMNVASSDSGRSEIANARFPRIRLFTVKRNPMLSPQDDIEQGEWVECSPATIPRFSAVAYFFGRHLYQTLNVPIGLIHSSRGGTAAEIWTSAETIKDDPDFKDSLDKLPIFAWGKNNLAKTERITKLLGGYPQKDKGLVHGVGVYADPGFDDSKWTSINVPGSWEDNGYPSIDGIGWYRKTFRLTKEEALSPATLRLSTIGDNDITWVNGKKIGATDLETTARVYRLDATSLKEGINTIATRVRDVGGPGGMNGKAEEIYIQAGGRKIEIGGQWKFKITEIMPDVLKLNPITYPTLLYNGMINPIIPFGIKGVIWYQGESNVPRTKQYYRIFPNLIRDWRTRWNQGDFPFLFVSLANLYRQPDLPTESSWAEMREAQTAALSIPNTGMALAVDIGSASTVHPGNKQDVGRRLALNALGIAYHKDIVYASPMFHSMKIEGSNVRISFNQTGSGLMARDRYGYIKGFSIAGSDRKFYWAMAKLVDDHTVVVFSDKVTEPVSVRYGWADNPADLNLYNKEGLPVNPFRTDNWPRASK